MGLIVILNEERHGNEASKDEEEEAIRVKVELLRSREEREHWRTIVFGYLQLKNIKPNQTKPKCLIRNLTLFIIL